MTGPVFDAISADGKSVFLSGIYRGFSKSGHIRSIETDGFWRDGTVWKVDTATGKAGVFYAMDAKEVITDLQKRRESPIGSALGSYAAFHGVAVDREGRVFLCDRQHERVLVLGPDGGILRELPVKYPDAIALSPDGKTVYVTIRADKFHFTGDIQGGSKAYRYTSGGKIGLVKFADWQNDDKPSASLDIAGTGHEYSSGGRSFVLATKSKDGAGVNVWVAYHSIPVCIYKDLGGRFEVRKDFMQESKQTCLDLQRIAVDPKTEAVYIPDGFGSLFRVTDWTEPRFVRCRMPDKKPISASSVAVDPRNRFLYCRNKGKGLGWAGSMKRYNLDGAEGHMAPAPVGATGKYAVTDNNIQAAWHITWGDGDRGLAVGPDGSMATLDRSNSEKEKNVFAEGQLRIFKRDETKVPWDQLDMGLRGKRLGAIRYDLRGNLYVGIQKPGKNIPGMFANDKLIRRIMGVIVKFEPTGSIANGDLYTTAPKGPAKTYDIPLGAYGNKWFRTPRFGVDGWGRIYYPTSIVQTVSVIDNSGNEVLRFGTWGNRDSMAGLPGDRVPTKDVPMAYPNSVDATDDYIYVGDMGNCRLLRLAKTFAAEETVAVK
jgi:DNA-binding beta-propeller fold protein YncE